MRYELLEALFNLSIYLLFYRVSLIYYVHFIVLYIFICFQCGILCTSERNSVLDKRYIINITILE